MHEGMSQTCFIRVDGPESAPAGGNVLPVIESLLPVKFCFGDGNGGQYGGELLLQEVETSRVVRKAVVPSLRVPPVSDAPAGDLPRPVEVRFADDAEVPFPFRGRTLTTLVAGEPAPLVPQQTETVLATAGARPVWTVALEAGVRHFRSSFAPPVMPADGNLREVLHGGRFLEALPLLHFLHGVCAERLYEGPPLRACFMFDDPNLHWPRYGYVDYRRIAEQAAKENYHVAFATVPLDNWFTHPAAAELFRRHPKQLSMLVHGNNHTHRELARPLPESERQALLWQALRRIERLERTAGFEISRVMAAPHGACSEEMLESLARCGFESATISHGSLRAHNRERAWTRSLGYLPAELIHGCPVLPRWRLAANATNTILLAAFLRQPIILVGHHRDLKDGSELMDHLARFINGLGAVTWGNLTELSRSNYFRRREGDTLKIKPLGRKVVVQLPPGVRRLVVANPLPRTWESWKITNGTGTGWKARPGETVVFAEHASPALLIETESRRPVSPPVISPRRSPLALARRLATEARDRLRLPTVPRSRRRPPGPAGEPVAPGIPLDDATAARRKPA
jgi:hypothetical protein